tara:strand:- start:1866 stop:2582 length:717 start_codon:yes stop_codon:yes gene_type:complete
MNIKYVYTNGCSYSDGTGLKNTEVDEGKVTYIDKYSGFLSKKFNSTDVNEARGGESNQRIYRKTFDWITNNQDKLEETIFVIQLTYPVRNEIWSVYKDNNAEISDADRHWWGAQYGHDGYSAWDHNERDTSVDRDEINFNYVPTNKECSEISWRYVLGLQSYFESKNIKYIFFEGDRNPDGFMDRDCNITKLINFDYFYEEPFLKSAENRLTECNHPNEEVQIEWADKLYNFINESWG